jgi:hypothetical protein
MVLIPTIGRDEGLIGSPEPTKVSPENVKLSLKGAAAAK